VTALIHETYRRRVGHAGSRGLGRTGRPFTAEETDRFGLLFGETEADGK
jgi:hypothetical protein